MGVCLTISMEQKGRIAILVTQLLLKAQFHPWTFKTSVLVIKLYYYTQFHPRTMNMIVLILKLSILSSILFKNYQSVFYYVNFYF